MPSILAMRSLLLLWILLGILATGYAQNDEPRLALVVGVADYKDAADSFFAPLTSPLKDAGDIAAMLAKVGFSLHGGKPLLNPTRRELKDAVDSFGDALQKSGGVGLFYYSGHGVQDEEGQANYMIPRGTNIRTAKDLSDEAVSVQRVLNRMSEAKNRLNLVFLDACRNNNLPRETKSGGAGLVAMRGASGLMVFFATQPNDIAFDNSNGSGSLFTRSLLKHLDTPGLSFMDMMGDVTQETESISFSMSGNKKRQSPFVSGTLSGRFYFVPAPSTPLPTPAVVDAKPFSRAKALYDQRQWREAAAAYEKELADSSTASSDDRQAAYFHLAKCYDQLGARLNARANYEALLSQFSSGDYIGPAALNGAKLYYAEKEYRSALPLYRRACVRLKDPMLVNEAAFFVGRCLEAIGQKLEAKLQYQDLAAVAESNQYRDASRLSMGRLLLEIGKYEEALKWLGPLADDANNGDIKVQASARRSQALFKLNRNDDARAAADSAMQLSEGRSTETLDLLARLNLEIGERQSGKNIRAQLSEPVGANLSEPEKEYARIVKRDGNGDERVMDEINHYLQENPTNPRVEIVAALKAEILRANGDYDYSARIFEVIGKNPKTLLGDALFLCGCCHMEQAHYKEAVEAFTKFQKQSPTHNNLGNALIQRGLANMRLKQYPAAKEDFQSFISKYAVAPERAFVFENLRLIEIEILKLK